MENELIALEEEGWRALALGDLGRLFPADGRTPRGIASTDLLAEVRGRVEAAGWRPAAVDLTIVAARPRLAEHLEPMRVASEGAYRAMANLEHLLRNVIRECR